MRTMVVVLAVAVAVVGVGCASAAGGEVRNRDVLTREEIVRTNLVNALELVRTERPQWLYRRGTRTMSGDTEVAVYLDGVRIGGPEALAEIPTINIAEMRHYSEREAQFKWGVGHLHGAIEVISLKG